MNFLWKHFARWLTSNPRRVDWLIERAQRTPYYDLPGYMNRWWVFNGYSKDEAGNFIPAPFPWLPSVRIHHILRRDEDRVPHNHPWKFRSIVLRGWYVEECLQPTGETITQYVGKGATYTRDTADYHRISQVSIGGVWTLFISYEKEGSWGFLVDGEHVYWRVYLDDNKAGA